MNRIFPIAFSFLFLFSQSHAQGSADKTAPWQDVATAIGRSGQAQADGAYKVGFPRGDMKVMVEGVQVKPTLALGSWVAFSSPANDAMMMGDLVLSEDEVTPVMTLLEESGIEVTALHNHVLHESPRVMYMHVDGHGDAVKLAASMKRALDLTKTPAPSAPPAQQPNLEFDTAGIEQALGRKGKVNGGVLQFGVPRMESITHGGMKVPGSMGLATGINFQPTGSGKAAITGDFVLIDSEVNPVIKALRASGIQVDRRP